MRRIPIAAAMPSLDEREARQGERHLKTQKILIRQMFYAAPCRSQYEIGAAYEIRCGRPMGNLNGDPALVAQS